MGILNTAKNVASSVAESTKDTAVNVYHKSKEYAEKGYEKSRDYANDRYEQWKQERHETQEYRKETKRQIKQAELEGEREGAIQGAKQRRYIESKKRYTQGQGSGIGGLGGIMNIGSNVSRNLSRERRTTINPLLQYSTPNNNLNSYLTGRTSKRNPMSILNSALFGKPVTKRKYRRRKR